MLTHYLDQQLAKARYKILEDGTFYGEISGLEGVWANAKALEACRNDLWEVLEDWLILKIHDSDTIPGFKINFDRRQFFKHA